MKSVVQALWLLTTAIGDSIIVLITALDLFDDMAVQFFAYAGIMYANHFMITNLTVAIVTTHNVTVTLLLT